MKCTLSLIITLTLVLTLTLTHTLTPTHTLTLTPTHKLTITLTHTLTLTLRTGGGVAAEGPVDAYLGASSEAALPEPSESGAGHESTQSGASNRYEGFKVWSTMFRLQDSGFRV